VWQQLENGRVVHRYEWIVLAATLAVIPVLVIEIDVKSAGWQTFAYTANWVIWSIFVAELAFVLIVAPRKGRSAPRALARRGNRSLHRASLREVLASLRLVRLVRLLRLLRLGVILGRAVQAERALTSGDALRLVALITVFVVVVSGAVESVVDTGDFHSLWDAIWWAVVTVTTVGYGDVYPTTVQGRIVAMVVMLVGIGFLSVLTATIASHFVKTERGTETTEIMATLKRVEAELAELRRQLARP
jgi:voltage-gated potassium channel